jgi:hypothetical protein
LTKSALRAMMGPASHCGEASTAKRTARRMVSFQLPAETLAQIRWLRRLKGWTATEAVAPARMGGGWRSGGPARRSWKERRRRFGRRWTWTI